ncbi:MAG: hypothetical protein ACIAXF_07455 [Phycisphaerales bacterium JB063]
MSKMTRQRKWLVGVLVLGVGAVVVDRAMLGGPESANASDGAAPQDGEAAATGSEAVADSSTPGDVVSADGPVDLSEFARRLEELPDVRDGTIGRRDVFELPAHWEPQLLEEAVQPDSEPEPVVADGRLGRAFQAKHTHDGAMQVGGVDYAIIDGKKICENQILDQFILRRFTNRQSLWESELTGELVLLPEIPTP